MINKSILENKKLLEEWIESRTSDSTKNITLERQIYAFYLLEKLIETQIEFIFKGGTALILLLQSTNRFSTDIDILISKPQLEKLEELFNNFVGDAEIFTSFERDLRSDSNFPKAHFKFFFKSIFENDDQDGYILLDAVFEENPYKLLEQVEICNQILPSIDPYIKVKIPSIPDIMIDKLTAFAPNTIGVHYERPSVYLKPKDQSREVVKQWFDVNELHQKCNCFSDLKSRYITLSDFEIKQRNLNASYIDCLKDTYFLVINYLSKGRIDLASYEKTKRGINRLKSFVNIPLDESYFISSSVNVIELISKVLCDDTKEYLDICELSKEQISYLELIKSLNAKSMVDLVKANNKTDLKRFVLSLRVIKKVMDI